MFCRACDYSLLGVHSGRCPECGRAFVPTDPATVASFPGQPSRSFRHLIGWLSALAIGLPAVAAVLGDAPFLIILICMVPGIIGLGAVAVGLHILRSQLLGQPPRILIAAAILAPVAWIVLVISLALHMRVTLGGWPTRLGMAGFPPALATHADIALGLWGILILFTLFVWPILLIGCAAIPPARRAVLPLGLFALAHAACVGGLLLMPSPFLRWWFD